MRRFFSVVGILICFVFATSCGQGGSDQVVTIKTKYGDIVAILYDETPKHKANFIKLAKEHFYDSTLFHRVIEGFMIQGGDPDSKSAAEGQPLGRGGPGYTLDAEVNPKFVHERGAIAAARLSDEQNPKRASNGSQFYIVQGRKYSEVELTHDQAKFETAAEKFFQNEANKPVLDSIMALGREASISGNGKAYEDYIMHIKPRIEKETGISTSRPLDPALKVYLTNGGAPQLDGAYTVFGKVIKGMDVVDKIAAVQKGQGDRPLENISMTVSVEEMAKSKIEKLYDYQYP